MRKFKIKVGDYVKIIAGSNKGSEGKVVSIVKKREKVVIEGLNLVKKHIKPNSKNPQGGIEEKEMPMSIPNVAIYNPTTKKADRIGVRVNDEGVKERFFKSNGEAVIWCKYKVGDKWLDYKNNIKMKLFRSFRRS